MKEKDGLKKKHRKIPGNLNKFSIMFTSTLKHNETVIQTRSSTNKRRRSANENINKQQQEQQNSKKENENTNQNLKAFDKNSLQVSRNINQKKVKK